MIYPRIDQLLENVTERYALVIVAAKRARQINNYHHQLGEGTFDDNPPPLVESRSKNYLTMALEEIAEGKIKYTQYTRDLVPSGLPPADARVHAALGQRSRAPAGLSRLRRRNVVGDFGCRSGQNVGRGFFLGLPAASPPTRPVS